VRYPRIRFGGGGGQPRFCHLGLHGGGNLFSGVADNRGHGIPRFERRKRLAQRGRCGDWCDFPAERFAHALDGAGVQLRHARFVDAQLRTNVLHGHFVVVVEGHHPLFARRQRGNGVADAGLHFIALVLHVRALRLGGHHHGGQLRLIHVLSARERRGGFNGVDADDGLGETLFIGTDLMGEVGERRLVTERLAQLLAGGFKFPAHAAHASWPRVLAQRVDHRPADAAFREGLELDAP